MARTTRALNKTQIENAKPKDKEYILADGNGLILRVKPTGSKIWIFNYISPATNKRTNLTIGRYPALLLSDARAKLNKQDIDAFSFYRYSYSPHQ